MEDQAPLNTGTLEDDPGTGYGDRSSNEDYAPHCEETEGTSQDNRLSSPDHTPASHSAGEKTEDSESEPSNWHQRSEGESSSDESLTQTDQDQEERTRRLRPVTSRPRGGKQLPSDEPSDEENSEDEEEEKGDFSMDEEREVIKKESSDAGDDVQDRTEPAPQADDEDDENDVINNEGDDNDDKTASSEAEQATDDNMYNIADSSTSSQSHMHEHFVKLAEDLSAEDGHLKHIHFKDYTRLETLGDLVQNISDVCMQFDDYMVAVYTGINRLRTAVSDVKATVDSKINNEGLSSWLNGTQAHSSDKAAVATEKEMLQKAADVRAAAALLATDLARVETRAAKLEEEAAQAAADTATAVKEAQEAQVRAEEAKRAAEEKQRKEEEARRKAEEEKARKEAEEKRKREEEERKRQEEMLLAGTPEELERRRQEAERRDPRNWPVYVYSVDPGSIDIPVGCVLRCMGGAYARDDLVVERREQLGGTITLLDNEELVSNVISVSRVNPEAVIQQLEEPLSIAIPHCAPRSVISREPVVKMLNNDDTWVELETKDVTFDDIKEYKFVEVRLDEPDALLAVVTRTKRETHVVNKRGGKVTPSVDSRICMTFKQATVKSATSVTLEVQPVELSVVSDVKYRFPETCDCLLASSSIMRFSFLSGSRLYKPVTVNIPLPPNPSKLRSRPGTAAVNTGDHGDRLSSGKPRPVSAFPAAYQKQEEAEDCVFMLTKRDSGESWCIWEDCPIVQAKNKDIVNWEMAQPLDSRLLVLRLKPGTLDIQAERIANRLEACLRDRAVQIIVRQHGNDPSFVTAHCVNIHKSERIQKKLAEDHGYNEGPAPSDTLIMHEGQEIFLKFRGNVEDCSEEDRDLRFVFNSHIKTSIDLTIGEIDKFAQKGIHCFRGFIQFYTRAKVSRPVKKEEEKSSMGGQKKAGQVKTEEVEDDVLLSELLVCLPKPEPESPKPIVSRAPVTFLSDGLVDADMLRYLANEIGDEWRRLAHQLNIRKVRVQAIMRNNVNKDSDKAIYDMLVTWAKKVPRSMNKVDMLYTALMACGRADLAEELRDKEYCFKEERALKIRESVLHKAFVKVAQNEHIIGDWKFLLRQLGISESDLVTLEEENSGRRNRCLQGLMLWKEQVGENATDFPRRAEELQAMTHLHNPKEQQQQHRGRKWTRAEYFAHARNKQEDKMLSTCLENLTRSRFQRATSAKNDIRSVRESLVPLFQTTGYTSKTVAEGKSKGFRRKTVNFKEDQLVLSEENVNDLQYSDRTSNKTYHARKTETYRRAYAGLQRLNLNDDDRLFDQQQEHDKKKKRPILSSAFSKKSVARSPTSNNPNNSQLAQNDDGDIAHLTPELCQEANNTSGSTDTIRHDSIGSTTYATDQSNFVNSNCLNAGADKSCEKQPGPDQITSPEYTDDINNHQNSTSLKEAADEKELPTLEAMVMPSVFQTEETHRARDFVNPGFVAKHGRSMTSESLTSSFSQDFTLSVTDSGDGADDDDDDDCEGSGDDMDCEKRTSPKGEEKKVVEYKPDTPHDNADQHDNQPCTTDGSEFFAEILYSDSCENLQIKTNDDNRDQQLECCSNASSQRQEPRCPSADTASLSSIEKEETDKEEAPVYKINYSRLSLHSSPTRTLGSRAIIGREMEKPLCVLEKEAAVRILNRSVSAALAHNKFRSLQTDAEQAPDGHSVVNSGGHLRRLRRAKSAPAVRVAKYIRAVETGLNVDHLITQVSKLNVPISSARVKRERHAMTKGTCRRQLDAEMERKRGLIIQDKIRAFLEQLS